MNVQKLGLYILALFCLPDTTIKADLIIRVTGDGNSGSTWTLEGVGLAAPTTSTTRLYDWNFPTSPFLNFGGDPGTMDLDGAGGTVLESLNFDPFSGNLRLFLNTPLPGGTSLENAGGSFVNTMDSFGAGLAPNTTFVSGTANEFGTFTITNAVPEPSQASLLLSAILLSTLRRKRNQSC